MTRSLLTAMAALTVVAAPSRAQDATVQVETQADSVQIVLRAVDLTVAVQALGRYLDRPIMIDPGVEGAIPFFETPAPIHRQGVLSVLGGLVESQGFSLEVDSAFVRVRASGPESSPDLQAEGEAPDPELEPVLPALEIRLFTVPIVHARAAEVASVLNSLYGAPGEPQPRPGDPRFDPEEAALAPRGAVLLDQVTIVPDEITNALLIRATEHDFGLLEEVIRTLDVRPLQVLVEAVIVEARKDRRFSLGIAAELGETAFGDDGVTGSATLQGVSVGDLAVQVMGLGKRDLSVFLSAARSRGDVTIRSRPTLLASNGLEASILVGTQQPFVQFSRSLPTDEPQRDQVVQYRDVGTSLTVIPTINRQGYVTLDLTQEMSQATGETQFDAPVISSREATTRVTVRDGQTIVIGGLTDHVRDEGRTGIPILSDLPLIGGLFGSTTTRTTETEIFVFITPTIVFDDLTVATETDARLPEDLRSGLTRTQLVRLYSLPEVLEPQLRLWLLPLTLPEIRR